MRREFHEQSASLDEVVEALQAVSPGSSLEVKEAKHFRWRVAFLTTPHVQIWKGQGNADWTGSAVATEERFSLIIPTAGVVQATAGRLHHVSEGASALIVTNPDRVIVSAAGQPENAQINVKWQPSAFREVLARIYEREGPPILPPPLFDLRTRQGQLFHFLARGLAAGHFQDIGGSASASALISETMLRLIIEGSNVGADSVLTKMPASASSRQVQAAIELMYEKLHEPLTLSKIAEQLGISGRSLQQGFRRYQDTTPLAHLRQLRLEAVHRELSNPLNTLPVSEVAAKWGFAHVGRLAKLYRDSYGRSPSETIRQAQRRR